MPIASVTEHFLFAMAVVALTVCLVAGMLLAVFYRFVADSEDSAAFPSTELALLRDGGVAVALAFLVGILLIHLLGDRAPIGTRHFLPIAAAVLLIGVGSRGSGLRTRLGKMSAISLLLAVAALMAAGVVIDELQIRWLGAGSWGGWVYPVTLIWVLAFTLTFRRMNGLEGLAASSAVIASAFFCAIAFRQGSWFIYMSNLALCAAVLGFLIFNWHPAKIHLGNVGATFLGFAFAVMAIVAARYDHAHTSLAVLPLLLLHLGFDTGFTIVRKLWQGQWSRSTSRSGHLYQLLGGLGYSPRQVTLAYAGLAMVQGFSAIWMVNIPGEQRLLVYLPFLLVYLVMGTLIARRAAGAPDAKPEVT